MMDCDIAYYEYYDCQTITQVQVLNDNGEIEECNYYLYTRKNGELDESTPVIVYVTHGGGVADVERVYALEQGAKLDTQAIFIAPQTDYPPAVCTCIEDARVRLRGLGNFDAVSAHGTSSGGRAIMRAALESVEDGRDYHFRFANIFAYDPAAESKGVSIMTNTRGLYRLAKQGTVFIIQTDTDVNATFGGSAWHCNRYARIYSLYGGKAIVAQAGSLTHEYLYLEPIQSNSLNWSVGRGSMTEDQYYHNKWFYYDMGEKIPASFGEVTAIVQESLRNGDNAAGEAPAAEVPIAAKEPASTREPPAAEVPIAAEEPTPVEEPAPTEEPTTTEEPVGQRTVIRIRRAAS